MQNSRLAAAQIWENAILDQAHPFMAVKVSVLAQAANDLPPGAIALAFTMGVDGTALARFDNSSLSDWYFDPTPFDHSEFSITETLSTFPGATRDIIVGRQGPPIPGGDADGRLDFLTVALHELGHVLGLNASSGESPSLRPGFTLPARGSTTTLPIDPELGLGSFSVLMDTTTGGHLTIG